MKPIDENNRHADIKLENKKETNRHGSTKLNNIEETNRWNQ